VRSYTTLDGLRIQHASGEDIELFTELGQLVFSPGSGTNLLSFHIEQHPVMKFDAGEPDDSGQHRESGLRFQVLRYGGEPIVLIPLWFVVSIVGVVAALPMIRWSNRFGLRTLLIATTLVALVLGLVVYTARR
jgi:hypothetical protein